MAEVGDSPADQLRERATSTPSTIAVPNEGRRLVARMRSRVVFPAPFGPVSEISRPASMLSETPASAALRPKSRASSTVTTAGGVSGGPEGVGAA